MDQELHIPAGIVTGTIVTLATTVLGWIIKVAARETLKGFQQSIRQHTDALRALTSTVDEHRREMADLRVVQADFNARLKALEKGGGERA